MSDGSSEKHNLSRRDFIKIAGSLTGAAAIGGLIYKWVNGEPISASELQLMNTPEAFVGENGEKLSEKIQEKISPMFKDKENSQEFKNQIEHLLGDIKRYAEAIKICNEEGFDLTLNHLNDIYYEKASFLQTMLNMSELYDIYSTDDMANICGIENLTSVWAAGTNVAGTFENRKYIVENILESATTIQEIPNYLYYTGDTRIIDSHNGGFGINPEWENDTHERVKEVSVIGFDAEVAELIKDDLSEMGLERSMAQLGVNYNSDGLGGVTNFDYDGDSKDFFIRTNLYWPKDTQLDLKTYQERRKTINHIIAHEPYHNLSSKRILLENIKDRLALRESELRIIERFNLTKDLNKLIKPDGEQVSYGFFDTDSDMSEYYVNWLNDEFPNHSGENDLGPAVLFSRFADKIYEITGENIDLSINPFHGDFQTMDEWIEKLDANKKDMGPYAKLFAETIIGSKEAILNQNRWKGNIFWVYPRIASLVFAHVVTNKSQDLKDLAVSKDIKNYIDAMGKQMKIALTGFRGEEFIAEVFSQAMMTKIYGSSALPKVNDSIGDCDEILKIFKKEGLAREQLPQTV